MIFIDLRQAFDMIFIGLRQAFDEPKRSVLGMQ